MSRGRGRSAHHFAANFAPRQRPCPDCQDSGFTSELVCCGRFLPTGECCSMPVPGDDYCDCSKGREAAGAPLLTLTSDLPDSSPSWPTASPSEDEDVPF